MAAWFVVNVEDSHTGTRREDGSFYGPVLFLAQGYSESEVSEREAADWPVTGPVFVNVRRAREDESLTGADRERFLASGKW